METVSEDSPETGAETDHGSGEIRVAIVDDQPLFTSGLGRVVDLQPDMRVVGEAHDGAAALELCRAVSPNVVLMDISMPVMDGVTATRELQERLPAVRILILTVHADDAHVFRGIRAGARGYLLKDCTPEDLARAIRTIHAGDTIMAPDIARKMLAAFEHINPHNSRLSPHLTDRELQVITALAQGKSNKQIAHALGISEKTVRNHASNLYKKLHLYDRTQAVLYAIREGLVDLNSLENPPV